MVTQVVQVAQQVMVVNHPQVARVELVALTLTMVEVVVLLELLGESADLMFVRDGIPEFSRRITAGTTSIERELRTCLAFWQRRDPSMTSVRVLVFGSAEASAQVSDTLSATPSWSVEIVDPLQQDWLNLVASDSDPDASEAVSGAALVRMSGLAAGEIFIDERLPSSR